MSAEARLGSHLISRGQARLVGSVSVLHNGGVRSSQPSSRGFCTSNFFFLGN